MQFMPNLKIEPVNHHLDGSAMTLEEFEQHYRQAMEDALTQLQTATLLVAQAEARITQIGQTLHLLNRDVEQFIDHRRQ